MRARTVNETLNEGAIITAEANEIKKQAIAIIKKYGKEVKNDDIIKLQKELNSKLNKYDIYFKTKEEVNKDMSQISLGEQISNGKENFNIIKVSEELVPEIEKYIRKNSLDELMKKSKEVEGLWFVAQNVESGDKEGSFMENDEIGDSIRGYYDVFHGIICVALNNYIIGASDWNMIDDPMEMISILMHELVHKEQNKRDQRSKETVKKDKFISSNPSVNYRLQQNEITAWSKTMVEELETEWLAADKDIDYIRRFIKMFKAKGGNIRNKKTSWYAYNPSPEDSEKIKKMKRSRLRKQETTLYQYLLDFIKRYPELKEDKIIKEII